MSAGHPSHRFDIQDQRLSHNRKGVTSVGHPFFFTTFHQRYSDVEFRVQETIDGHQSSYRTGAQALFITYSRLSSHEK